MRARWFGIKVPCLFPKKLRNAPTQLAKDLGHGKEYRYPHNFEGHYVHETYLPEKLAGTRFYHPTESGTESAIKARLDLLRENLQTDEADE